MKIFVSYKRRDAGDFAKQIYEHLKDKHDIFIDMNIQVGDIWSNTIADNISACDVFVIIVTYGALESQEVEKEVLQAQRENKTIIPCIHRDVEKDYIRWDLSRYQGIEFYNEYELARSLYSRIVRQKTRPKDTTDKVVRPNLKSASETKDDNFISNSNTTTSRSVGAPIKSDYNSFRYTPASIPNSFQMSSPTSNNSGNNKYLFEQEWKIDGLPQSIAVDSEGSTYVIVSKYIGGHPEFSHYVYKFDRNAKLLKKWGNREGASDGEFSHPKGIAVDSSGYVYVADGLNNRIQKFDNDGNFLLKWGTNYNQPKGIAVDSSGYVYVDGGFDDQIRKFDNDGNFITEWDLAASRKESIITAGIKWGDLAASRKESIITAGILSIDDIAVDSSGFVYVACSAYVSDSRDYVINNHGFAYMAGRAYVSDSSVHIIEKFDSNTEFDSDDNFITEWDLGTGRKDQKCDIRAIAVDSSGYVYLVDYDDHCIQIFDNNGRFITKLGGKGKGNGQFDRPTGIAVDSSGYLYVSDSNNHRIQKFKKS